MTEVKQAPRSFFSAQITVANVIWAFTALFIAGSSWQAVNGSVSANEKALVSMRADLNEQNERLDSLDKRVMEDRLDLVQTLSGIQADLKYLRDSVTRIDKRIEPRGSVN